MLAISGLATSCQPISAVIAAGFEVVSEAKPTATTHTTPVRQQREAEAVEDQGGVRAWAGWMRTRKCRPAPGA